MTVKHARLLLLATSLFLSLVAAEVAYRTALFSPGDRFRTLKHPGLYADYFSEDLYWKLHSALPGKYQPPRRPHPLLGWVGSFSPATLRHHDFRRLKRRRPVLLYGDSFAACIGDTPCFEDILNADPKFSSRHYLLNYGVGSYGIDQTLLLLQNSIDHFDQPFVVFSLLTFDIDRCVLSFRIGQKPRFSVTGGALELEANPFYANAEEYLAAHPPRVFSYLYRRLLFGGLLPARISDALRREKLSRRRKMEVSQKILTAALSELRARRLDFVFLVFHGDRPTDNSLFGGTDWREEFLRDWLAENNVPTIWSKDIVAKDRRPGFTNVDDYIDPKSLHPTEHFNRLLAQEISLRVLESQRRSASGD